MAGMLATILATPCSAPFVGTAVAAALSGGIGALFGIFLAMGLGLALPWLLVAARPSLVGFLPRPGRWMIWLKNLMAALLAATMIWLGTILATVLSPTVNSAIQLDGQLTNQLNNQLNNQANSEISGLWSPWSQDRTARLLAGGDVVFIDVTADWCVTCKANKAFVLDRAPVNAVLSAASASGDLHLLQADWTRPDPEIAAFLADHGRFGIPFNMLVSPRLDAPVILPELLTSQIVLEALEKAGIAAK